MKFDNTCLPDKLKKYMEEITDDNELYRMLINGLTVEPFLEVKAVNDEYCDSYSLLGSDDGQESLLELINAINY